MREGCCVLWRRRSCGRGAGGEPGVNVVEEEEVVAEDWHVVEGGNGSGSGSGRGGSDGGRDSGHSSGGIVGKGL